MQIDASRAKELFLAVLEMPAHEQAIYLDAACAGDAALRERIADMLRSHEDSGELLPRPPAQMLADAGARPKIGGAAALDMNAQAEGNVVAPQDRAAPNDNTVAEDDAENGPISLDFLQPSSKPGALGRLAHYEVLEVLGQGGFGAVVRAFDEKLHRMVAIKIMSPQLAATSPARKRFLREARSSAAIRHENVVDIHAIEEQPIPFLVMEYVAGETLQQRLDRVGPLDAAEVLRIGVQIAHGLAAAHAMGKIHRDIKPANILLENGVDRVKITDFGLARAADDASLTQSGIIAGTPMYMAPEQAQGVALDHRADLFSLGSVLYVMCSGRPPFRASTTLAVLKRVAEDTPRPVREIIPEVPAWLCDIITKLHAKKPEDRFGSAKEVADLMARYLAEMQLHGKVQTVVATLPPTAVAAGGSSEALSPAAIDKFPVAKLERQLGRPSPRNPRRWLVPAAALLVLVLLGWWLAEVVLRVETEKGTLLVEIKDDDVEARIKGGKLILTGPDGKVRYTLSPSERNKLLAAGSYKISVTGADGVEFDTPEFVLKKGAAVTVRVTLDAKALAGKQGPPAADPDRKAAALLFDPGSRVQGIATVLELSRPFTIEGHVRPHESKTSRKVISAAKNFALYVGPTWEFRSTGKDPLNHVLKAPALANQTSHVACVYDGNEVRLFVSGKLVGSKNVGDDPLTPLRTSLFLGGGFDGTLENVRISQVARYAVDFTPQKRFEPDADTLLLYHFDEGEGEILKDSSGNKHHGKIVGAKWVKVDGTPLDPDRRAAEWVLSIGGTIKIDEGGTARDIKAEAELPKNAFRLTHFVLEGNDRVRDADLALFKECKSLLLCNLGGTQVSDQGLAYLKECKNLTDVGLHSTRVSDAGVAQFKECKDLSALYLGATPVTDVGLARLKECASLRYLFLENNMQISDTGLVHFKDYKSLVGIELTGTQVGDAGLAHLKECKNLRKLYLAKTRVTAGGIDELKKALPQCKIEWDGGVIEPTMTADPDRRAAEWVLKIGGEVRVNDLPRGDLANTDLPREPFVLTYVGLNENEQVTDAGLAHFKDCKNVKNLYLSKTSTSDTGLAHFKDCKDLRVLHLGGTRIGDAGLAHLKDCANLISLSLPATQMSDAGLAYFKDCKNLKLISLSFGNVSDTGLAHLKDCKNLTDLALGSTQVTDAGLVHFKNCKNLTNLYLDNTKVGDAGLANFKDCKNLSILNLSVTAVSDAGLANFTDCKGLTDLRLKKTKVTAAKIDELKKALPQCKIEWDGGVIEPPR